MLRNQGRDHILRFVPTQEVSWRGEVGVRLADTTGLSQKILAGYKRHHAASAHLTSWVPWAPH